MKPKRKKTGPKPRIMDAKRTVIAIKLSKREIKIFKAAAKRDGMALSPWLVEPRRKEFFK